MTSVASRPGSRQVLRNFVNGALVTAADERTSDVIDPSTGEAYAAAPVSGPRDRSEERRVGKECLHQCRSRWSPYH